MNDLPKLRADLITREVDDEVLLCDPQSGEIYLLNPTAAVIAELCDGQTSLQSMAQEILTVLAADPGIVQSDVDRTVEDFGKKGLLERRE